MRKKVHLLTELQEEANHLLIHPVPEIGLRMVKSTVAVLICLVMATLMQRSSMRIYASIAALQCIQPYNGSSKKMALQRLSGTAVGTLFGAAAILVEVYLLHNHGTLMGYALIALFILPLLWTTVYLDMRNASYFSCVVFLSITVSHITDMNPWLFALDRCMETLVGIAVGIGINSLHLPRRKRRDILFVSGLDGVLLNAQYQMTPYSKVLLNRMIDDGMLFTISTMRTPASVLEASEGLRFQLPIIVMDGSALYDIQKKEFLHAKFLSKDLTLACCAVLEQHGLGCFINGLLNDVLMIYYDELRNEAEQDIYRRLHTSPYRNYVSRKYYNQCAVLYLMSIDRTPRVQEAYDALVCSGLAGQVRIRFYPSEEYPGFSYLKIYEKTVSRQAMLDLLKKDLGIEKSVTFGSVECEADVIAHNEPDGNKMVKRIERMYEPLLWKKD